MAFKRSLFGYRRSEVEEALAARDVALAEGATALAWHAAELERYRTRVTQLELVCHQLADRVVMRQRELAAVRAELAELGTELDGARAELAGARAELARGRLGRRGGERGGGAPAGARPGDPDPAAGAARRGGAVASGSRS